MVEALPLADKVWLLRYPLRTFGMRLGRNVTVMALEDGRLVIHSTAPFTPEDRQRFESLGEPAWILEANRFHDTFRKHAGKTFPELPYLAPEGFPGGSEALRPPPEAWRDQVEVLEIGGMPSLREHAFFHRASGTLVVADLLFHLPPETDGWTLGMLRLMAGLRDFPGNSRSFRFFIRDRAAFDESIRRILEWPIERIVVGHGEPIETDARETLRRIFRDLGSKL